MLAAHPTIGTIYGIDRKWKQLGTLKHLQKEWQLLCALRKQHYHLVINLADQWRSAIVTRFTGAPVRLGFAFNKRNNPFWRFCHSDLVSVANHKSLHTVEQNLSILSPLQVAPEPAVTMAYSAEDWHHAHQQLVQKEWAITTSSFSRHHAGSSNAGMKAKWRKPSPRCNRMGIPLYSRPGRIKRAGDDRSHTRRLTENGVVSLAGQLTLRQLASLIDHACLFIGVDSVPMHMAAALQTPCVALFGPSKLTFWSPWQVNGEVIWLATTVPFPIPTLLIPKRKNAISTPFLLMLSSPLQGDICHETPSSGDCSPKVSP